jgi:hypothetical protein
LRTLLELCDGLASNSFGTHLGYAVHCQRRLHWLDAACDQTLTSLSGQQQDRETVEWNRRLELGQDIRACGDDRDAVRSLLDPYWGFSYGRDPETMARLLRGTAL